MAIKQVYVSLMKEKATLRELEAATNKQKKLVDELSDKMLIELQEAGTDSYKSSLGGIAVLTTELPSVVNWEDFYDYIHQHEAYDLLQRRVGQSAWRERIEEGEHIPGVEVFEKKTLRITLTK